MLREPVRRSTRLSTVHSPYAKLDQATNASVRIIRTLAAHPRNLIQSGSVSLPSLGPDTTNIIAPMIGTATMPLMTAAQNNMRIGSILVVASAAPPSVAAPTIA